MEDLVDWWIPKYENDLYRNRVRGRDLDSMDSGKKEPCADSCDHVNHKGQEALMSKSNNTTDVYRNGGPRCTVVKVLCYKSEGRWFDSRWCH